MRLMNMIKRKKLKQKRKKKKQKRKSMLNQIYCAVLNLVFTSTISTSIILFLQIGKI